MVDAIETDEVRVRMMCVDDGLMVEMFALDKEAIAEIYPLGVTFDMLLHENESSLDEGVSFELLTHARVVVDVVVVVLVLVFLVQGLGI